MSKIIIKINSGNASPALISDIRKTTGLGVGFIADSLRNDSVLKTYNLFGNDQEEVEYELLKLLHEVRRAGADFKIYEFLFDEEVIPEELDSHEISEEVLRNMLNGWHQEVARQEDLFDGGADNDSGGNSKKDFIN